MQSNGTKFRMLVFGCLISMPIFAKDIKPAAVQAVQKPLCFIENNGQIADQNGNVRHDIQYKLATSGMKLYIGNAQMHYQFVKTENVSKTTLPTVNTYRMDMVLEGANTHAQVASADEQAYFETYYTGISGDGITAHSYNKVIYKDVYPNIDWVVYVKNGKVEYDFIVHEGGNINDIKLKYNGATALSQSANGGVIAETPMGNVVAAAPVAYESASGKKVVSKFVLNGNNEISFQAGAHHGDLTIDPYLDWATYFGGTLEDAITGVASDANGNIFASGFTASTVGIATGGAFQGAFGGGSYDAFLVEYNAAGSLAWATYFGGTGTDVGNSVAVDAGGNVYMAGSTTTAGGLASPGSYQPANAGGQDAFLIKFNPGGGRTWSTFFGGSGKEAGNAVYCDPAGNVILAGSTQSAAGIATAGSYQTAINGLTNGFVAKFSPRGAMQWATYYGGSAEDEIYALAIDAAGNIIVAGQASSAGDIATLGTYQVSLSGVNDAFVASFAAAGTLNWGSYFGGPGSEQGNGVTVDASGNVYLVGNTNSTTNVASAKAYQTTFGGGPQDGFLASFTNTGGINWATYYGGNSVDYGQCVTVDIFGNIIMGGATFSTTGIATTYGYQTTLGGDYDAFYAKFNVYGQNINGSYFGNTLYEYGNGITTNPSSNVFLGGYTSSTTGIATAGAPQTTYGGGIYDGFVAEFSIDTLVSVNQPFIDTIVCQGGTLTVNYTTNIAYQPGNVFTVELSSITGSFAAPVVIGTSAATTSGSVTCVIPAGTAVGTGYLIRIVSSSPSYISPSNIHAIDVVSNLASQIVTGNSPVCVGGTLDLYDSASYQITAYSWTGPNGFTSAVKDPVITGLVAADSGMYYVFGSHNGCPAIEDSISIDVNSYIPPTPTDSSNAPICSNRALNFYSNSGITSSVYYFWSGPNGYTSTLQNPTINPATTINAGTYYVHDSLNACNSPLDSVVVIVHSDTAATITITPIPNDTVCFGDSIRFTMYTTNPGLDPAFQWYIDNSPVTGAAYSTYTSSVLVNGSVIYCTMASSIQCPDNLLDTSNKITVDIVNNTPVTTITVSPDSNIVAGQTVTFTGYAVTFGTITGYQWYLNGSAITGATSTTFTVSDVTHSESVYMEAYTSAVCAETGKSNTIGVHVNTGVASVNNANDLVLFPNPNTGIFEVSGTFDQVVTGTATIEVLNPLGQVVYTGGVAIHNNAMHSEIDLSHTQAGVYLLRMTYNGITKVSRFTIE